MATGLLIVCVGKATKVVDRYSNILSESYFVRLPGTISCGLSYFKFLFVRISSAAMLEFDLQ